MKVNINHPTFVSFLENITDNILSNNIVDKYFTLPPEKKMGLQYVVLNLLKNSVKSKLTITDDELISFVVLLWKKNIDSENYELASVLKDISNNFKAINEFTKSSLGSPKRETRTIKIDKKINDKQ